MTRLNKGNGSHNILALYTNALTASLIQSLLLSLGICQPLVLFEFTSGFFFFFLLCSIVDNMNLFMQIILIDMILHKRKAYRHLLFNMLNLGAGDSKAQILFLPL